MPDVQVRITTTGAEQAVAAFGQVTAGAQRFGGAVSTASNAALGHERAVRDVGRELRTLAFTLSGAAAVASIFARNNEELQQKLQIVSLTIAAVAAMTRLLGASLRLLSLSEVALVIAALAAVVAIGVLLIQHWEDVRKAAVRVWSAIGQFFGDIGSALQKVFSGLADIVAGFFTRDLARMQLGQAEFAAGIAAVNKVAVDLGQSISTVTVKAVKALEDAFGKNAEAAKKAAEAWRQHIEALVKIGKTYEGVSSEAERFFRSSAQWVEYQKLLARIAEGNRQVNESARLLGQQVPVAMNDAAASAKRLHDAVQATLAGVLTGTSTFADLWQQIWVKAVDQIIAKIVEIQAVINFVSGILGGVLGIFGIHFQRGGSFIATRPTPLMVGESGAERVTVSPLAGAPATGGGGMTVNFNAPQFWDQVTYANFIKKVGRDLTSGPVSRVG